MALMKCPECEHEISELAKKCPNCGFQNKKKNQKQIMLVVMIGIMVIIGSGIYYLATAGKRNEKNMIKYLESIGYTCRKEVEHNKCQRGSGIKLEIMEIGNDANYAIYTIESKNEYQITVPSSIYSSNVSRNLEVIDYYHDEQIFFEPEDLTEEMRKQSYYWEIGDIAVPMYQGKSDFTEKVNDALREFESYYKNSKVKLGR